MVGIRAHHHVVRSVTRWQPSPSVTRDHASITQNKEQYNVQKSIKYKERQKKVVFNI